MIDHHDVQRNLAALQLQAELILQCLEEVRAVRIHARSRRGCSALPLRQRGGRERLRCVRESDVIAAGEAVSSMTCREPRAAAASDNNATKPFMRNPFATMRPGLTNSNHEGHEKRRRTRKI